MQYSVTILKSFSTSVNVEADSVEEAKELAYDQEPNDSIIGFDWEPDGESEAFAVYETDGGQVWSAHEEATQISAEVLAKAVEREDQLRQLLSYCRVEGDAVHRVRNAAQRALYREFANRLAEILDGEN